VHGGQRALHVLARVEVLEDVEGRDHEVEAFLQTHAPQVAAHEAHALAHLDLRFAHALLRAREHRRHRVDAHDLGAALRHRERDAPGAAAELEHARAHHLGEIRVEAQVFFSTSVRLVVVDGVLVVRLGAHAELLVVEEGLGHAVCVRRGARGVERGCRT